MILIKKNISQISVEKYCFENQHFFYIRLFFKYYLFLTCKVSQKYTDSLLKDIDNI